MLTDYQLQHMRKELIENGMTTADALEDARQFCGKYGYDDNSAAITESKGRFYIEKAEDVTMIRTWETQHRIKEG